MALARAQPGQRWGPAQCSLCRCQPSSGHNGCSAPATQVTDEVAVTWAWAKDPAAGAGTARTCSGLAVLGSGEGIKPQRMLTSKGVAQVGLSGQAQGGSLGLAQRETGGLALYGNRRTTRLRACRGGSSDPRLRLSPTAGFHWGEPPAAQQVGGTGEASPPQAAQAKPKPLPGCEWQAGCKPSCPAPEGACDSRGSAAGWELTAPP